MVDPDIIAYLQAHMSRVPLEDLRRYLTKEGLSDIDFDEALQAAKERTAPPLIKRPPPRRSGPFILLASAALAILFGVAAYQRFSGRQGPLIAGILNKKSALLEQKLGRELAEFSPQRDRLDDASYRLEYLTKRDSIRQSRSDLAAAYNTEGTPDLAVEILKSLILESQKPEVIGMTDFSQTNSALMIRASYYREFARSFGLQKDSDHRDKALKKAEELEKKAEALDSREKKEEATQQKNTAASKQKELEDILK